MRRQVFILIMIGILCVSCQGRNEADKPLSLTGTKWKLAGIVDIETGALKVLEPKNCKECYTLTFDADYLATARSIETTLSLDLLNLDPVANIEEVLWCETSDEDGQHYCDSHNYRIAILTTGDYHATSDELRLFHFYSHLGKPMFYLLFNPLKP